MVWANAAMLLGTLLVAAPVVLHLTMRPKPKKLEFPALRFVAKRQMANRRQMQLRHLLLLLLRCLVIVLPVLAFARPIISSTLASGWATAASLAGIGLIVTFLAVAAWSRGAQRVLCWTLAILAIVLLTASGGYASVLWIGGSSRQMVGTAAPVAAAFVFDTSPRMGYRNQNQTRLEQAQKTTRSLIDQLPDASQLAVIDSQSAAAVFSLDRSAALNTIDQLRTAGAPRGLSQILDEALDLLATSELERREIYILTDRTEAAWREAIDSDLAQRLELAADTAVYLIDVGIDNPSNTALGELVLSSDTIVRGAPLTVEAAVTRIGDATDVGVELLLEEQDPSLPVIRDGELITPASRPRGRREVSVSPEAGETVRFELAGLEPGTYHGRLRLTGEDALAIDRQRYFSLEVNEPPAVLAVAPEGTATSLATEAIAPLELRRNGQALFRVDTIEPQQLGGQVLDEYRVVLLLDPAPLPASVWNRLGDFVRAGGGLAIFLGGNATPMSAFSDSAAQQLLPGPLKRQWNAGDRLCYLTPREMNHPAVAAFRSVGSTVPWADMPIDKHWQFDTIAADASVIIEYSNRRPAMLERRVGEGSVVTMTTPVTDRAYQQGRPAWNTLPTALGNWPFVVLMHELTGYLAGSGEAKLNYLVGESAELTNDPRRYPLRYELFVPEESPQSVTARDDRLAVTFTSAAGVYRLKGNLDGPVSRGFSVNYPPEASRLERAEPALLDAALGVDRYRLLTSGEQIKRELADVRVGREFYPHLLLLAALALALEQLMSNMFYRPQVAQ